jgi:nucleoside-diphosphate-sugar epimerase
MNLVFGASGFLGSQTTISLTNFNHNVKAIMRNSSNPWRLQGRSDICVVNLDQSEYLSYLESISPSVVVAANWEGVRNPLRSDKKTQENSARSILKLAAAAKKIGVKTFITFGSQAEVNASSKKISETYALSPVGIYGETKARLAQDLKEMFRGSGTRFCWVRPFSIYGPRDSAAALVPQMFLAASRGLKYEVTHPNLDWSYLHVSDFGTAMLTILENYELEDVINVGSSESIPIVNVAKLAEREIVKLFPNWSGITLNEQKEIKGRIPSTRKLHESSWLAQVPIEKGIAETVQWLSGCGHQHDMWGT